MDTELILRRLIDVIQFSVQDKNDVEEMLDHNEWGLAYEIICTTLEQQHIKLTAGDYELIKTLGEKMGYSPCSWENIEHLSL